MSSKKKWLFISLFSFALVLIGLRIALPHIILNVVNKKLTEIDDYTGHVEDIDLFLIAGSYKIQGIELNKKSGQIPVPFFSAENIDLSVEWKALFKGAIVGEIELNRPMLNYVKGPTEATTQTDIDEDWTKVVDELMPLKINRLEITQGEVHYRDFHSEPKVDLVANNIHVLATNLTNANDNEELLPSSASASADVYGGNMSASMKLNPLNLTPTFDMNAEVKSLDLSQLNDFLKAYGKFDVKTGNVSVYMEAATRDSTITGYVKPLISDLDVVQWKEEEGTFWQKVWESMIESVGWVFKNHPEDQLATRVDFEGSLQGPDVSIFSIIGQTLRNAFIQALYPSLENSVTIAKLPGKDEQDKSKLEKEYDKIAGDEGEKEGKKRRRDK